MFTQELKIKEEYVNKLYELRKHKGLTLKEAEKLVEDNVYFATKWGKYIKNT